MKRIWALLLAGLVLLSLGPVSALAAEADVRIDSVEDFVRFADACALEEYSADRTFSLTVDLDLSNTGFTAVPYFAGTFKGNGHVILGLTLTAEGSRQGLFRQLGEGAVVRNLYVKGTVAPGGSRCYVGGIAGVNRGSIQSCSFEGRVAGLDFVGGIAGENTETGSLRDCVFRGSAEGEHQVGGIVGSNRGQVSNCTNNGAVNTVEITPSGESRFDLASLTVDDFLDLANIGGIAGDNESLLLNCRNNGDVGYRYTGYNVGGVAGKSAGFLSGCSSYGSIKGRRDVGGIAGQLIPYAAWDLSDGKLDALSAEIGALNGLLSAAAQDAQGLSLDIVRELAQMNGFLNNAVEALQDVLLRYEADNIDLINSLVVDPETGIISFDPGFGFPDTGDLTAALYSLYGQSIVLAEAVGDGAGALTDDVANISSQMSRVFNSLFATVGNMQNVTGETCDLSDSESYAHDIGAIASCGNYGAAEAENNVGGIAGSIAFELAFDREDQLNASEYLLSNAKKYLFAVIRDCGSYGEVRVKQDHAGCIVGDMDIGAVVNCVALGTVAAESGNYVGGIAGESRGSIRESWARSVLSGGKYIGGIAGSGESIRGCRAWSHIERGSEYLGAVAGWAEGEIADNLYVAGRPAGVDDVSRSGQCRPVEASALLAMEGVPRDFDTLTLRFVADGQLIQTVELPFGGSVAQLPQVANKGEQYWKWDDFDQEHIYYSMQVEGRYYAPNTTIASPEEPPLFLVEGVFYEGQSLSVAAYSPALPAEQVLAAYTLYVDGYTGDLTVRMNQAAAGSLYVTNADGVLQKTPCTRDGTYVVFRMANGASFVYAKTEPGPGWPLYAGLGAGAAALAAAVWITLRRHKKQAKAESPA